MAADNKAASPSPYAVAQMFAKQYYTTLATNPEGLVVFYKDESQMSLFNVGDDKDTPAPAARGPQAIGDLVKTMSFKSARVYIEGIDAHSSINNTFVVMVTGDMTFEDGDNVAKRFSQTFVLAPGPKSSYYVHNDLIRFLKDDEYVEADEVATLQEVKSVPEAEAAPGAAVVSSPTPSPEPLPEPVREEPAQHVPQKAEEPAAPAAEEPIAPAAAPVPEMSEPAPEPEPALAPAPVPTGPPAPKTWANIAKGGDTPAPAPVPASPAKQPAPKRAPAPAPAPAAPKPAPAPAAAAPAPRSEERREKIPREKGPGLFVSNIPAGTAHADLEALFVAKLSPQFKVAGASVLERGIGFVDLVEPEAVKFCLDNGPWLINGSEIRIEAKKPPRKDSEGRRGGGRGGRGGSGRGGERGERGGDRREPMDGNKERAPRRE